MAEMTSAKSVDEARARAARLLQAFEQAVLAAEAQVRVAPLPHLQACQNGSVCAVPLLLDRVKESQYTCGVCSGRRRTLGLSSASVPPSIASGPAGVRCRKRVKAAITSYPVRQREPLLLSCYSAVVSAAAASVCLASCNQHST